MARSIDVEAPLVELIPAKWLPREAGRASKGAKWAGRVSRLLVFAALMALWEIASGRWIDPFFVGKPSAIIARLVKWVLDGTFIFNFTVTAQEAVLGFLLGATAGLLVGLALGTSLYLSYVFEPLFMSVYSLPKVALIPLFIVWFGIRIQSKIALAATLVFFLVLFNTLSGVRDVDRRLLDAVRLMGANRLSLYTKVIIPSALNAMFVGLKISLPQALVGAVVGELWAASRGIGYLVGYTGSQFDVNGTFAALAGLLVISLALTAVLDAAEARVLQWRRLPLS